jgi:4-amino-4-deoxy-L-arabinose transferase-like glycosyltransferase
MVLADPLNAAAYTDHPEPPRHRWQLWRSPDGQPTWARPVLLGIAAVAAALYAWNITRAGLAPFYSVAVKSMSESWKAFFYGAFDPKATITIDKLSGSFLPQALSARIFGYSAWSLALPQVIEGVISVLVMYRVVRRWAGVMPGLLAAAIFTLTPIAASMFGHSMEDGALTMCLVLAADAYQRAVTQARLRSLIWAGVWVGLGFQAKMLQAWIVLPALAVGYLMAASAPLRRRLWQLGVAGIVMLAVSLSWIALYTFTPASDRPYVDGSTDNSAVAMVFGYNGLERFGIKINGAVTSGPGVASGGFGRAGSAQSGTGGPTGFPARGEFPAHGGTSGGSGFPGGTVPGGTVPGGTVPGGGAGLRLTSAGSFGTGWTKLLGSEYGPEIGWLYPLAVLSLVFGLVWTRQAKRTDQVRAGFIMWGTWLVTFGLVFSKMSMIPHTAYVASLAPPLAALSAAGTVMFWRAYRAGGWRGWVLPAAVAVQSAWALFLWRDYGGFLPWARDAIAVAGIAAIAAMVVAKLSRRAWARLATVGLAVGVAAVLAAPGTWAASVLDAKYAGSSFNASAGPAGGGFGGFGGFGGRSGVAGVSAGGGGMLGASTTLTSTENRIYDYVNAHRDGAGYLMAVDSWSQASPYILTTGQEVLAMGGFSGSVPEPTLARVEQLVHSGQLRFFLISGESGLGPAMGGHGSTSAAIDSWVDSACTKVPAADYGATATTSASGTGFGGPAGFGGFGGPGGGTQILYQCGRDA